MKKKILLLGDHPLSIGGNANMMRATISQLDQEKYDFAVISVNDGKLQPDLFTPIPFTVIGPETGIFRGQKLLNILSSRSIKFDVLLSVGIDIFTLAPIVSQIAQIRDSREFVWGAIFPYDLYDVRKDWVLWIKYLDFPCVFSEYGYEKLVDHVPNIRYFRPAMYEHEKFTPFDDDRRKLVRKQRFPSVKENQFVFGFFGNNQFRKDPQRLIKAFSLVKKIYPDVVLYIHDDIAWDERSNKVFNLKQAAEDYGLVTGDVISKKAGLLYSTDTMVDIYNSINCLVNSSMQEGLSWTILEAMLCGCPVVATDNTAQSELLRDEEGNFVAVVVPMNEPGFVPVLTSGGSSFVDSKHCHPLDVKEAMLEAMTNRRALSQAARERALDWISGVDDVNVLLAEMCAVNVKTQKREAKIIFVQQGSAGDVLLSTQCFKGIKEKHPGLPLCYMTQTRFMDLVEENPYIDELISWDPIYPMKCAVVYNPHGDHILPGKFNSQDVPLHAMYPYFCKVDADDIYIAESLPDFVIEEEYMVVHTTGGDPRTRTYKHMDLVIDSLPICTVQIGGKGDASAKVDVDLRGKLSWREAAYVVKRAKAAVVVDSYPSHLAAALGTPVIVLYGPAPARITGPRADKGKVINMQPDWLDVCPILGSCYGDYECESPCINSINPFDVRTALLELLS